MARLLHQTEEEDLGDLDLLLARHCRTPPRLEPSRPDVLLASIPSDWKEAEVAGWPIPEPGTGHFPCHHLRDVSTRSLAGHDGRQPSLVTAVLYHPEFPAMVDQIKQLAQHGLSGQTELRFHCKSGRHRSVATVILLATLLRHQGYTVAVAHHGLADSQHMHDRASCADCSRKLAPSVKADLLAMW